jgi:uncharacterized protein (DUF1330 family)
MSVFWIGRAQVRDEDGIRNYVEHMKIAAAIYKPEVLVRKGQYKVLEGPDAFDRFAVLRFPSMDDALRYYNSPEYQTAAAFRREACDQCELVLVEGVE